MKKNFLDLIPCRNPLFLWEQDTEGMVTVHVVNTGFFNRLSQRLFRKPRVSHIRLDRYGSFIWQQLDGKRTIYDIARLVQAQFGKEAEPLFERLVPYFRTLYQYRFIC